MFNDQLKGSVIRKNVMNFFQWNVFVGKVFLMSKGVTFMANS